MIIYVLLLVIIFIYLVDLLVVHWILKILNCLILFIHFILNVHLLLWFHWWINVFFMHFLYFLICIFTQIFIVYLILPLNFSLIPFIDLIISILIDKLIILSAWHIWSRLRHWSWSISHHLIILILRIIELLEVSFLSYILIKIMFRFHLLHLKFLPLIH